MAWFRVDTDIKDNPKLRFLPESVQLRFLWCLALHKEGRLVNQPISKIAFCLHLPEPEVADLLKSLVEHRLLLDNFSPKGWEERQFQSDSSTPRVQKHRAKINETFPKRSIGNVPQHNTTQTQHNTTQHILDTKAEEDSDPLLSAKAEKKQASSHASARDRLRLEEWESWKKALAAEAQQDAGLPAAWTAAYLDEANRSLGEYYEGRGGRMTPTRYAWLAKALSKHPATRVLFAIEIFCDNHGGAKDERYLRGIAARLARLSPDEFQADMKRHRAKVPNGLYEAAEC